MSISIAGISKATADGSYAPVVLPEKYGAVGNGTIDDTAALQAWLASGNAKLKLAPGKTYTTTASLTLPAGVSIDGRGATIKATATITAPLLDTPVGSLHQRTRIDGLTLDCNSKADNGFYLRYAAHFTAAELTVLSPNSHAVILGDPAAAGASYEVELSELNVLRPNGQAVPVGSYGIWAHNIQDSRVHRRNVIVGMDVGIRADRGSNIYEDVHVWGFGGYQPSICFDDNSDNNTYIACHGDGPTQYCWRVRTFRAALIACHMYVGVTAVGGDNTVTGVYFDLAAPTAVLLGCYFEGADGTHRLAKDVDAAFNTWNGAVDALGTRWNNVVTQNLKATNSFAAGRFFGNLAITADSSNALGVRAADGTYVVNVNTSNGSRRAEVWNQADLRGTSDAGTTEIWKIGGLSGLVRPGRFTTAGRPTGAARLTGGIGYDTDIQTYVYWDGTNWRNFANTIV